MLFCRFNEKDLEITSKHIWILEEKSHNHLKNRKKTIENVIYMHFAHCFNEKSSLKALSSEKWCIHSIKSVRSKTSIPGNWIKTLTKKKFFKQKHYFSSLKKRDEYEITKKCYYLFFNAFFSFFIIKHNFCWKNKRNEKNLHNPYNRNFYVLFLCRFIIKIHMFGMLNIFLFVEMITSRCENIRQ